MKSKLRKVFNHYDHEGTSGYFQLKNLLETGLSFEVKARSFKEEPLLTKKEFFCRLLQEELSPYITFIYNDPELYQRWSRLCLFFEDVYEFSVEQEGEVVFEAKESLNYQEMLVMALSSQEQKTMVSTKVFIKLHKESVFRKTLEQGFFGRGKRALAQQWKEQIVNKMKFYIEELRQFESFEVKKKEITRLQSLYIERLGKFGLKFSKEQTTYSIVPSDFGVKDMSKLFHLRDSILGPNEQFPLKTDIIISEEKNQILLEEQRKVLDFFSK